MNIIFRRNYWILVIAGVILTALSLIGLTRIISYNFEGGSTAKIEGKNYDNEIYIFDTEQVHKIEIGLSRDDYEMMISTYQKTGEKDYFRTYVTIDGVTIPDTGVRLKGNLTLRQTLGGEGMRPEDGEDRAVGPGGGMMQNFKDIDFDTVDLDEFELPAFMKYPEDWDKRTEEEKRESLKALFENIQMPGRDRGNFNADGVGAGAMAMPEDTKNVPIGGGPGGASGDNPPYLIKFDEFVEGQTYEGFAEIAVRLGSDESLLGEPVAFALHETMGQIVPETSYAVVDVADNEESLYVIAEHLDEKYIEKHFPDEDGILYKAGNFVGFEYKGDDPTLYAESYEQKTNKGDDDMFQLIQFLKFVSESSDEEFENQLNDWLDIDSMVRMIILDDLLQNQDCFGGMGSNYYLFYSKTTGIFTILSWDQNLAMGGMGAMGGGMMGGKENPEGVAQPESAEARQNIMDEWMKEGGFGAQGGGGGMKMGNSSNVLKTRFMANEKFKALYDQEYERIKAAIFRDGLGSQIVEQLSAPFIEYNQNNKIIDMDKYMEQVTSKKSFFDL